MLYKLGDREPVIRGNYFIAPGCHIVGTVDIGDNVNIWFNTVIRADNDWIRIGENTNIQDGSILHVDPGQPINIGKKVVIGHKVMLHGCDIGDETLIGMNSVVLNGASIGRHCLIGANTLIPENMVIPDESLVLGSPGKIIKKISAEQKRHLLIGADDYVEQAERFKASLTPIVP